ncbi:MAG: alpha/beta hydrolase [Micropepsaceae bacterium]
MSILRWVGRIIVLLIVLAAIAYPVADLLRAPLDQEARDELLRAGKADKFVTLSSGVMHVRVQGPEDGPVVLMVHGNSTGGFAFQRWMEPLTGAGFRVVVPDMLGYGYSDRPDATHDAKFFLDQLAELLAQLNITQPIHIIGSSMGGAIVADFVAADPARIRSVTLIAPAGLGEIVPQGALSARLYLAPVVGDWIARVLGATLSLRRMAQSEAGHVEGFADWMGEQTKYRGFAEGQLNTLRHYDLQDRLTSYEVVGRSGLPVLAIWGTADKTVPFAHSKELLTRLPQAKLVPIEGKPHNLPLLEPTALTAIVLPFLQAHIQATLEHNQTEP